MVVISAGQLTGMPGGWDICHLKGANQRHSQQKAETARLGNVSHPPRRGIGLLKNLGQGSERGTEGMEEGEDLPLWSREK